MPLAVGAPCDVNPVWVVRDYLLNTRWGHGVPLAGIDDPSYQASFNYVQSESILVSPCLDRAQSGLRHLEELLTFYDGYLLMSQGLIRFGVRQPAVAGFTVQFGDYTMDKLPIVTRPGPRDTKNRILVEWTNRIGQYNIAFVKLDDDPDIKDTGERSMQISLPGVTTLGVAQKILARAFLTHRPRKLALTHGLDPKWGLQEAGDLYVCQAPGVEVTDTTFRIVGMTEDPDWGLAIESIEDPFAIVPAISTFPVQGDVSGSGSGPPGPTPVSTTVGTVVELPPGVVGTGVLRLAVVAAGTGGWTGANVSISRDGINFALVGQVGPTPFGVNTAPFSLGVPTLILPVDLTESRGTLVSVSPTSFAALQNPLVFGVTLATVNPPGPLANNAVEWLAYENAALVSGNRYNLDTFGRGVYDTIPQAWPTGTQFVAGGVSTVLLVPFTQADAGNILYFRFDPLGAFGSAVQALQPTYLQFRPVGLALLPAPVSLLQIQTPSGVLLGSGTAF